MINGGVVRASACYPQGKITVMGAFNSTKFEIGSNWIVDRMRNYRLLDSWRVEGVGSANRINAPREMMMVLAPLSPFKETDPPIHADDILIIGDGARPAGITYTELEFNETDLEVITNDPVEVGPEKYPGVVLLDQPPGFHKWSKPKRLVIFHHKEVAFPQSVTTFVRLGNRKYQATLQLPDTYIDHKIVVIRDTIKKLPITLHAEVIRFLEAQMGVFQNEMVPKAS